MQFPFIPYLSTRGTCLFWSNVRHFLLLCLWCISPGLRAGGGNPPLGARAAALGGASVCLSDVWSAGNNPGTLGHFDRFAAGVAYESGYFMPGTGLKTMVASLPAGRGTVGLMASSSGYKSFSDNRLGLAYAMPLADYLRIGVRVGYLQTRIGDIYGSRSTVVAEVGLLATPAENVRFGVHLYNPNRAKMADFDDERVPTTLRIGGQYIFSEKVSAVLELDKDTDLPLNARAGVEYNPVEQVFVRVGLATLQGCFAIGMGYKWKTFRADVAATWHQDLGYSSGVALVCEFGNHRR